MIRCAQVAVIPDTFAESILKSSGKKMNFIREEEAVVKREEEEGNCFRWEKKKETRKSNGETTLCNLMSF